MAAEGFIAIKLAQGHCLQVKMSSLMFYGEMTKLFKLTVKYACLSQGIGGNRKRSEQLTNMDHKSLETEL